MRYVPLVSSQNCGYAPWRDVIPCPESLRARWLRRPVPKVDRCLLALGTGRSGAVWEGRAQLTGPCLPSCLPSCIVIAGSRPSGCRLFGAQIIALR